jgi:hypothetical protein
MAKGRLIEIWELASSDLNFIIESPFFIELSSGEKINAELLVRDFGPPKGMIIFTEFDVIAQHIEEIADMGFGFSVLDEPRENENYVQSDFIELLSDWGWSGDPTREPQWIKS